MKGISLRPFHLAVLLIPASTALAGGQTAESSDVFPGDKVQETGRDSGPPMPSA
jgi:hypothetical protein